MSANQIYREDGTPESAHEYEDRSIHFCLDQDNQTYLYGVFDGHDGANAAHFASQVSTIFIFDFLIFMKNCLVNLLVYEDHSRQYRLRVLFFNSI